MALIHDCAEITDEVYSIIIDLQNHPLEEATGLHMQTEAVLWTKETEKLGTQL